MVESCTEPSFLNHHTHCLIVHMNHMAGFAAAAPFRAGVIYLVVDPGVLVFGCLDVDDHRAALIASDFKVYAIHAAQAPKWYKDQCWERVV